MNSELSEEREMFKEYFETDNEEYNPLYPNDYESVIKLILFRC
jgi:hypothetical protein